MVTSGLELYTVVVLGIFSLGVFFANELSTSGAFFFFRIRLVPLLDSSSLL